MSHTAAQKRPETDSVAEAASRLLADTYTLYVKTHGFHWNVTGPHFASLHALFEEQYRDLAGAADEIAERIRALGYEAPGSFEAFSRLASVREASSAPDAETMIRTLATDHETLSSVATTVVEAAQAAGDEATADLAIGRIRASDKAAWMLRSHLA